jgi:hypothetical protein
MDAHFLLLLVVSTVVLAAIYMLHVSIDQRIRELAAEQSRIGGMIAPHDHQGQEGDIAFFKLADILTGGQRVLESQGTMPTIVEEADASADPADPPEDPAEQVGVRKRNRGTGEIKTGG